MGWTMRDKRTLVGGGGGLLRPYENEDKTLLADNSYCLSVRIELSFVRKLEPSVSVTVN